MNNLISTIQYFFIIPAELTVLFLGIGTIVALILCIYRKTNSDSGFRVAGFGETFWVLRGKGGSSCCG
jgi:hypothetical protein